MDEAAGNEYMNKTLEGVKFTVYATQDTVESDSFNNTYDANATYPVLSLIHILPVFYARVRGQGGSSHKWQLRCKCADPSAVFQQHAALFLHIRSTPFG